MGLWDLDILALGRWANFVRRRRHPEARVTYVVDRNVNYTNICLSGCRLLRFFPATRTCRGVPAAWEELARKLEETLALGGTGILLQAASIPIYPLAIMKELVRFIRPVPVCRCMVSPPRRSFFLPKRSS